MRLNLRKHHSHSCPVPGMGHLTHRRKVRAGMLNPDQDSRPRWKRILRAHATSEQTQVAGLLDKLHFGFEIGHLNTGYKCVAPRAWTLRLHENNPLLDLWVAAGLHAVYIRMVQRSRRCGMRYWFSSLAAGLYQKLNSFPPQSSIVCDEKPLRSTTQKGQRQ